MVMVLENSIERMLSSSQLIKLSTKSTPLILPFHYEELLVYISGKSLKNLINNDASGGWDAQSQPDF